MFCGRFSVMVLDAMILGTVFLSSVAFAQRHGAGGNNAGGINGSVSGSNRATGIDEQDTLKDFHEALAAQATSEQVAEFQALLKSTDTAKAQLQDYLQELSKQGAQPAFRTATPDHAALDQALDNARNGTKKFEEGLSAEQKSRLKEIAKRLSKADSDLEQDQRKLDQAVDAKVPAGEVSAHAEVLDKAIADFYTEQLALGREMSITLSSGQDLTFMLPQVKNPVNIANQTIAVTVSGGLSQIAVQGSQRTFKLELVADLSDLQQNITDLLRAQLDTSDLCGQRIAIRQANLEPSAPAGLLSIRLHFERWTCNRMFGQVTPSELAEGDGTVEIKLTASVESPSTLKVTAALGRIDAGGMMADSLHSGSLGDDLRETVSESVLSALRAGADLKVALPTAVQNSATLQSAKFRESGAGVLDAVLEGQMELSSDQSNLLASQLNQALSAKGTPPQ